MIGTDLGYNIDHKNELLIVDFMASLRSDIQKAREEAWQNALDRLWLEDFICISRKREYSCRRGTE